MIIVNHSFNEYCNLSELERSEFDAVISNSIQFNESVDVFKVGELSEHGFGIVKDIQYSINCNSLIWNEFFEYTSKLTKIAIDELKNKSMLELMQFRNYLVSEIIRINELENILLSRSV